MKINFLITQKMYVSSSKIKGGFSNDKKNSILFNDNNYAHYVTWNSINIIICLSEQNFIIKEITLYASNVRWTVNEPKILSKKCGKSLTRRYALNINDCYKLWLIIKKQKCCSKSMNR